MGYGTVTAGQRLTDDTVTSMPLLATGWNEEILEWDAVSPDPRIATTVSSTPGAMPPSWFPIDHFHSDTLNMTEVGAERETGLFSGWLLPYFELGNPNPVPSLDTSGTGTEPDDGGWYRRYLPSYDNRWNRSGEDIMAANVLAFDIRGFDNTAPLFATSGPDGQPGRAGVNDDGIGGADVTEVIGLDAYTELGYQGSDDEAVQVSDLGIYNLISNAIVAVPPFDPNDNTTFGAASSRQGLISRSGFVDLAYPYLGGSPLHDLSLSGNPVVQARIGNFLSTNCLGIRSDQPARGGIQANRGDAMKASGRLVHTPGGGILLFQPTYDTWTDSYETDGFDQMQTFSGSPPDPDPPASVAFLGTVWNLKSPDPAEPFLDNSRVLAGNVFQQALQIDTGLSVDGYKECPPPVVTKLPAISMMLRINDPSTQEIAEYTVIEDLQ